MAGSILTFVNHASFLLEDGAIRLLCDPWLKGSAFINSWDLLSPVVFNPLADPSAPTFPTHIWISHEHPDHFSVPTLLSIPAEARANVHIVFQRTTDARVANFCRKAGFTVIEVDHRQTIELSPTTALTVLRNGTEDSSAHIVSGDTVYLNINDCMFESRKELRQLLGGLASPDVLLGQFSYAEGIGGPDDTERRRTAAGFWLNRFFEAISAFEPKVAVPFASFKVFSHVENAYLNDAFPLDELVTAVRERGVRAALLYPGDVLDDGAATPERFAAAAARYRADIDAGHEMHEAGPSVSAADLIERASTYVARLRATHTPRALAILGRLPDPIGLKATPIRLWDLDTTFTLSPMAGLVESPAVPEARAVCMHSESLQQWLDNDFGASTVLISGRFRASDAMTSRVYRWAHLGMMTAASQPLSLGYAASSIGRVARTLIRRRAN